MSPYHSESPNPPAPPASLSPITSAAPPGCVHGRRHPFATAAPLAARGRLRRVLLAILPLLVNLLALAPAPAARAGEPWKVRVVDVEGRPVPGARVELRPGATAHDISQRHLGLPGTVVPSITAIAGPDGRCVLEAQANELGLLVVSAPGRFTSSWPRVPDAPLGNPTLTVQLHDAEMVEVRAVDPAGKPLSGARVFVTPQPGRPLHLDRWLSAAPTAHTGEDGRVRLAALRNERIRLVALPPVGRTDLAASVEVPARAGEIASLVLRAAVPRTVEARRPSGESAAGVLVELAPGLPLALTGEDGRAVVGVPADGLALRLAAADRSHARVELKAARPETEGTVAAGPAGTDPPPETVPADGAASPPVFVRLVPPVAIRGTVLSSGDGQPIPGATVYLWNDAVTRTGADGSFLLHRSADRLPPGPEGAIKIAAWAEGFEPIFEDHPVLPEEGVSIRLQPAAGLAGRVVDGEDRAVEGAHVEAWLIHAWWPGGRAPYPAGETRTGADGRFRLSPLAAESVVEVRVEHPDFAPVVRQEASLERGEVRDGLEVRLEAGHRAQVRVLDTAGRPIAGARARLRPHGEGGGDLVDEGWHVCDEAGRCRFGSLASGRFDLQADAPGHARQTVPGVELHAAASRPDQPADLGTVHLEAAVAVRGRVVDDRGMPVAGALLEPSSERQPPDPWLLPETSALSGPDGRYELGGLADGQALDLLVTARSHAPVLLSQVEPPAKDLEVELPRTASVSGRVVDGAGAPVRGWVTQTPPVSAIRAGSTWRPPAAPTDADGRFDLLEAMPGISSLRVSSDRGEAREPLDLEPGERLEDVRLVLQEKADAARLTGRVTATDGTPIAGARVEWRTTGSSGSSGRSFGAGSDGTFEMGNLTGGEMGDLTVDHPDYQRRSLAVTLVAGENPVEVVLEPGGVPVTGQVVDADGFPVAGARVTLAWSEEGGLRPNPYLASHDTLTAEDGSFSLAGADAGTYRLGASAEGRVPAVLEEPLVVRESPVTGLRLVLREGRTLAGRVEGLDPGRLLEARVRIYPIAAEKGLHGTPHLAAVDHAGRFRLTGLAPGRWQVELLLGAGEVRQRQTVVVPPDADPPEVVLEVAAGYTLSGTVRINGEPAPGTKLWLHGPNGDTFQARSGPGGRFRFEGVEAGEYTLRGDRLAWQAPIRLDGDREMDFDFDAAILVVRVVDDTGRPLEGRLGLTSGRDGWSSSLPGGVVRLPLAAAQHELEVTAPGFLPEERTVVLAPGEERTVEIRMRRGNAAVLDLSADPPPGPVEVWRLRPEQSPALLARAPVDGTGRLEIPGLPEGASSLLVSAPGRALSIVEVHLPGPAVPVALPPEARLELRMEGFDATAGTPGVRLLDGAGRPLWLTGPSGFLDTLHGAPGGRLDLANLPAGVWTLEVRQEERRWRVPVTTVAGQVVRLPLDSSPVP